MLIAGSGKDLNKLTTRAEVQRDFGAPVASGSEEGKSYDEFRTRRKISDNGAAQALGTLSGMSFGLAEVVLFPMEVWRVSWQAVAGQTLRFTYDEEGNVKSVKNDGEPLEFIPHYDKPADKQEKPPPTGP
jgi:YD repeat-containing protein